MNLGAPELLILLVWVVPVTVTLWALVDVQSRPDWAWMRTGQSKTLFTVLLVVGVPFCMVGLVTAVVYLAVVRPQLVTQQRFGGNPPPPPPPGWGT
ncbi:MAG TPA: hypothetical protein VGJ43_11225 [Acidimicrobiales bacterium]|jgi:hypothetical protein